MELVKSLFPAPLCEVPACHDDRARNFIFIYLTGKLNFLVDLSQFAAIQAKGIRLYVEICYFMHIY